MSATHWKRVDGIFAAALTLPAVARPDYVSRASGGDEALRAEVMALLDGVEAADAYFDARSPSLLLARTTSPSLPEGHRVGAYRLVEPLGEGGMGLVYLAERGDGHFERRVAVKLVHPARVRSSDVIERFLRERQILARLEHPNIARLHDGGVSDEGWPYLVMEHIEGRPIDVYCDVQRVRVRERIRLVQDVGRAVHYAHRNLVIHRDLKPSNILVTSEGVIKLLDFGIAKLLEDDAPALATETRARPLTPAYAAPEQLQGGPVTTASDVYALGALLYELLTGRLPHDRAEPAGWEGRVASDRPSPDAPSVAFMKGPRAGDDEPVHVAAARGTEPGRLAREIAGDLDRICLMALRAEPDRRYPSAQAFVEDLQRYLDGLPVVARPDTIGYRVGKFVARHRTGVAAAAVVSLSLVAGLGAALQQGHVARVEGNKAREVSEFVLGLFETSDPERFSGEAITVRDLLDRGAGRIEHELDGQPVVQAEMYSLIGPIYSRLGLHEDGREMLARAMELARSLSGDGSRAHAAVTHEMARLEHRAGRLETAEELYRSSRAWLHALGPGSPEVARVEVDLARLLGIQGRHAEADQLFVRARETLAEAAAPPSELVLLDLAHTGALHALGDAEREDSLYARIMLNRAHLESERYLTLAAAMVDLGVRALYRGDAERAEPLLEGALELRREVHGEGHPDVGTVMADLAAAQRALGRREEALEIEKRAVEILRETLGPEHPEYASLLSSLAVRLSHNGDVEGGLALLTEVERIQSAALGEGHYGLAMTRRNVARSLVSLGRHEEALPLLEQGLSGWVAAMGEGDFFPWQTRLDIAHVLSVLGDADRAESLVEQVLARYRTDPPRGTALGDALVAQARLRASAGVLRAAAELSRAALADYDARDVPERSVTRAGAEGALGEYLTELGELASAEPLLLSALQTFDELRGPLNESTLLSRARLERLYRLWGRDADAERVAPPRP